MKQVVTDIVLMHRPCVPNGKVYTDFVFDDKGMGGLVEASGDVLLLEEFLVKHLHKSSSGNMLLSVAMKDGIVVTIEAINAKWSNYEPRDIHVQVARGMAGLPAFLLGLPRGGQCRIAWQIVAFLLCFVDERLPGQGFQMGA